MTTNTDTQAHGGGVEAQLREALAAAEPFVELLHSLTGEKRARSIVWKALKQIRAALAASPAAPAPAAGVRTSTDVLIDDCWEELCERDDRTSPAEYPDMCLITHAELADFMSRSASPAPDAKGER